MAFKFTILYIKFSIIFYTFLKLGHGNPEIHPLFLPPQRRRFRSSVRSRSNKNIQTFSRPASQITSHPAHQKGLQRTLTFLKLPLICDITRW